MPTTFRPYEPEQKLLLSPDLQEWLPEGRLAHHVSDLVDGLGGRGKRMQRKTGVLANPCGETSCRKSCVVGRTA